MATEIESLIKRAQEELRRLDADDDLESISESVKENLGDILDDIGEEADDLYTKVDTLESEVLELEQEPLTHETQFGEVKFKPDTIHHEQIMDALSTALEKGRTLHLLAYLEAYRSDLEQKVPDSSALIIALKQIKRRAYTDGMESESELIGYLDEIKELATDAIPAE
jgi:hypothetical protein